MAEESKRLTTPDEHKTFVLDNWDHLAAAAWRGFQDSGRGFISIEVDKVQTDPGRGEKFPPFCAYVSAQTLAEKGIEFPCPNLKGLVEKYDPKSSVVVHFWWRDSGKERHSIYRLASDPRPADTVWLGNVGQLKVRA